jgi:peptidyl-prolyl cis-trans isomerase D
MLQFIRDRAQSWIVVLIIGMLIIGLASFAWDAYFGPDPDVSVAKVNGEKITTNEFQREYQQQRARLQSMLGGTDISKVIPDEAQFKSNILKRMEEEELVLQAANENGFRVSDGLLAQQIRSFEAFQSNGKFDDSLYQQWLKQNQMSSADFEAMLRRDVVVQQYRMGVAATAWVTGKERHAILQKQEQQRDIGLVKIAAANYLTEITVSDEDAQSYYDSDKQRYATPEQVSIQYLELSLDALMGRVQIDEKALQEMYQERQADFGAAEERHVRHILIEVAGEGEKLAAAKAKAESLVKQLRGGASFEKLASENSDDIGSAKAGGDLGFLGRDGMMDPAFADAAFALKKGEISEPVKSAYGYHIIKLEDIKAGQQRSFAEVRPQLEQDFRHKQAEESFFEQSETLSNLTFEHPESLEPAAQQLGLQINVTPLFTRDQGMVLAANPDIRKLAFSDEVLFQGNNSEVKEIGSNHLVVLRIKDHLESAVRPFAEVKEMIVAQLKQERAKAKAKEEGQAMLQALKANGDIEALVKEKKLSWQHVGLVKRADTAVDHEVVAKAFRMARPAEGGKAFSGIPLPSGDYAVIALLAVKDGDPAAMTEEQKQTAASSRERYYGISQLLGAVNDLRTGAEIKEYPENF